MSAEDQGEGVASAPGAEGIDLRVGVVDVEQTAGTLSVNDLSQYFDQRNRRIKQCPPHLFILFKREDGRRPSWGLNKAYIEQPRMLLPGLENLTAGRRVASEVVPRSHQAFHFKVAADTSDDAYFEHDARVVFSVSNPVKFIDMTGLDAKYPESAAHVGERFFIDFMSPIIRARLDSLTKKVDSDGINTLNAYPAIVSRYMFNQDYDVDAALFEIANCASEGRAAALPPPPDPTYDDQWTSFFDDYGVKLERFVSSIDQSQEIAAANLQKAQARAAVEQARIKADMELYIQQKHGEAAAAGAVTYMERIRDAVVHMFGDAASTPEGFRQTLLAFAEYKALNNPEPGQKLFINVGGGGGGGARADLVAQIEALLSDANAGRAAALPSATSPPAAARPSALAPPTPETVTPQSSPPAETVRLSPPDLARGPEDDAEEA